MTPIQWYSWLHDNFGELFALRYAWEHLDEIIAEYLAAQPGKEPRCK